MRKGFTLIELLAVIVILAIIALIAVPIVINIINDAKEESLKRSVQSYLDTVTNRIIQENLKVKYNPDECIIQEDGNLICSENSNELTTSDGTNILKIDIKGSKPSSGTIKLQNGKIIDIDGIYLENKYANFDENKNIVFSTLQMPTEPGLYDKNRKLIASWDELVNDYGFNISDAHYYPGHNESTMFKTIINNNQNLKKGKMLIISNSVTSIGGNAFQNMGLTNIIIPSSVTSIEQTAFQNCSSLESVTFENTTGWFILSSSNATSGDSIDVTDASTNAINLKSTYMGKYWKRS